MHLRRGAASVTLRHKESGAEASNRTLPPGPFSPSTVSVLWLGRLEGGWGESDKLCRR